MDTKEDIKKMTDAQLDSKVNDMCVAIQKRQKEIIEGLDKMAEEHVGPGIVKFRNINSTGITFSIGDDKSSMFGPSLEFDGDFYNRTYTDCRLNFRFTVNCVSLFDNESETYEQNKLMVKASIVLLCDSSFRKELGEYALEAIRELEKLRQEKDEYYSEIVERRDKKANDEKKKEKIEVFTEIEESIRGQKVSTDSYLRVFCPSNHIDLVSPYYFVYRGERVEPCAEQGRFFFDKKFPSMRTYSGVVKYVPVSGLKTSDNKKLL